MLSFRMCHSFQKLIKPPSPPTLFLEVVVVIE